MIALLEAWKAGLFRREQLLPNLLAGVVVGVVALPLAMAFAIASGLRPEQGIYTAIVAGLVVSLFGGSRVQIAGPTGAFVVLLVAIGAEFGVDGLLLATMMAGVILILLGLLRMGALLRFIPSPVIVGFTAGIGVIIFVGQWPAFFGLSAPPRGHFHEELLTLLRDFSNLHLPTTGLALLSLALVLLPGSFLGRAHPWLRRIPGPLLAMAGATAMTTLLPLPEIATIGSAFGGIPRGLPGWTPPEGVTLSRILALVAPAFTIAMLGAIESLLSAVVADGMAGTRHDPNQELIAQGAANVLTPLFGGFAATGAIARTATNIRNGGTSPLSGVVHSLVLLLVLLLLAPGAALIPLPALAAILFVVAWNMSEAPHLLWMVRRAPRADVGILLVTFLLTVFVDLIVAVNIGVILATLHFLGQMSRSVEVVDEGERGVGAELRELGIDQLPSGVLVYAIDGPFFFGGVEPLQRVLRETATDPEILILRLRWVPFIDMTGVQALEEVIRELRKRGVTVLVSGANRGVLRELIRGGIIGLLGRDHYFQQFTSALAAAIERRALPSPDPQISSAEGP